MRPRRSALVDSFEKLEWITVTVAVRSICGLFDQRAWPIAHGSSPKQSPLPLASSASKRKPMKRAPCGSTPTKSWQAPSRGPSVAARSAGTLCAVAAGRPLP